MNPFHPIVEALYCRLDENLREAFEERAGILQFEAGQTRELAECLAMLEVVRTNPLAVAQFVLVQGTLAGAPVTAISPNLPTAKAHLEALGATGVGLADLSMALSQLGGTARLTPLNSSQEN